MYCTGSNDFNSGEFDGIHARNWGKYTTAFSRSTPHEKA